ncbi:MAG: MFS transporter [Planctomycetota bacterium]
MATTDDPSDARPGLDLTRTPAGRRALFAAYYFVEGAPIGFLWWSLPAIYRANGVGTERIGELLAWLVLPWALKWVWTPLIDVPRSPRFGLRGWIVTAQLGMALTLLPLLFGRGALESDLLLVCLALHGICAATQDAAIDALMIRTTPRRERGALAAWMQAGMLVGRSLLGGGALLVLSRVGGRAVVLALLAVVVFGLGLALLYRSPRVGRESSEKGPRTEFVRALRSALTRRTTWYGLAFAAVAGAGFEAVGGFASTLLTDRAGGDVEFAGSFFLVPAGVATVLGGFVGGRLADSLGPRRGTSIAGGVLAAALLAYSASAAWGDPTTPWPVVPWLVLVYVSIGWFTASSYALFVHWTDVRLGATQFSAYMGATNLCESWSVWFAGGILIPRLGYGGAFALLTLVGLLALSAVLLAPEPKPDDAHLAPEP